MADNNKIREEVNALTERLETGIQDLYTSDKYRAYLDTLSRFHNYSTRNTMLIHLQMPEASQVAGFNKWKNEFERHVMKGQKGIRIFAPAPFIVKREMEKFDPDTQAPMLDTDGKPVVEEVDVTIPAFKPVSVFDVSQTDGKPLPSLAEDLTGDVRQYEAFMDALKGVSVMPIGFEALSPDTDGVCRYDSRTIAIREGMSEIQTVAAAIHEMTHAELHDYNQQLEQQEQEDAGREDAADQDGEESAPKPRSRRAEEVEAESVSYVVCQHYGIETGANSFGYIAHWSNGRELNELKASLEIIRKAAASMIDRIDGQFAEICKERGIDLTPAQDATEQTADAPAQEAQPAPATPEQAAPPEPETTAPSRKYYITERQREQAERMAAKWEARAEAFYVGGEGWGLDTAGYCKTPEEAEKAEGRAASIHHAIDSLMSGYGTWADVQIIQEAVSGRDELDAQVATNQDIRAATQEAEQQEQAAPANPEVEPATATENAAMRPTELQQKGIEIAKRYEILPLQDRINIIAETFGCKTASIRTSPCTGKWRGTSDISIDLDNGASLFIGNHRTPQAKTARVQNECVNGALASYNPQVVSEIKTRAIPALLKREAEDNAIAAQKGLKPYTFLNVELNDGSDEQSGGHLGWYYATVAVDGKIFALVETGLNYDIAQGVLSESRPNYFVAGALKENEVDFVYNNVGHSSTSGLYKLHLSDNARERAEKTLAERIAVDRTEPQDVSEAVETPEKQYDLGYGHMGNGLTVWNRLEEKNGDYVTVAHIDPDRSVTFYDKDMPDSVKARIEDVARTSNMTVSATQDTPVFSTPAQAAEQEQAAPEHDPDEILPDPAISLSERDLYGYKDPAILPLLQDRALELFDADHTIYMLYPDGTEEMAFDRADIETHDGIFGIEAEEWQAAREFQDMKAATQNSEASKEALLIYGKENTYGIYQLKGGDETRDYRFEPLDRLEARGLSVDRDNYELVYMGPLTIRDSLINLNQIYETFNIDRPEDFTGHSVSVSDVIALQWRGNVTSHYVDSDGFKELPIFLGNEKQPELDSSSQDIPIASKVWGVPGQDGGQPAPGQQPELAATEAERWENDHIADATMSTPPPVTGPTVAELEAQVKAGQQISLLDLANAVKNEPPKTPGRKAPAHSSKKEKPSILAQLKETQKALAQGKEPEKSAPKRNSDREV